MKRPPVIVSVAMDEEAAPFLAQASSAASPEHRGAAEVTELDLAGRRVVLVRTGIGHVNATSGVTSVLIALGDAPQVVVSAGTAGGIHVDSAVGEVIVGDRFVNSQADATAFGYELGQVPGMPASYSPDAAVAALARQTRDDSPVRRGLMLSSDTFVSEPRVGPTREQWPDALSVDMETAALGQTCFNLGVPFVSIRAISDLCGPSEFNAHVDDAADRSAAVVIDLIERLP